MGAKQSKRSVDISGKEALEGEVAAAGAGGEGRLEQLADADVKPQLNGDAQHIETPAITEKEKQLDNGTPENEKDSTTEKEGKEQQNETEKERTPVTNGENGEAEAKPETGETPSEEGKKPKKEKVSVKLFSFPLRKQEKDKETTPAKEEDKEQEKESDKESSPVTNGENGDAEASAENTPNSEEEKKPKKEKVKKKWSLRSISFSRKDKPKQEKKEKKDEQTTNGDAEKLPEEAAEATPEIVENKEAESKPETEVQEEKTPETPVTEPITNGSSAPESPKPETPATEELASSLKESPAAPEPIPEPEHLPVNGLSLEEKTPEAQPAKSKTEEKPTEPAQAPEIPVKTEVCAEQIALETPPPPLPACPPPSSVASFAATTMAPELPGVAHTPATDLAHTKTDDSTNNDIVEPTITETQIKPDNAPLTNVVSAAEQTENVTDHNTEQTSLNEKETPVPLPVSEPAESEPVVIETLSAPESISNSIPEPVLQPELASEPEFVSEPVLESVPTSELVERSVESPESEAADFPPPEPEVEETSAPISESELNILLPTETVAETAPIPSDINETESLTETAAQEKIENDIDNLQDKLESTSITESETVTNVEADIPAVTDVPAHIDNTPEDLSDDDLPPPPPVEDEIKSNGINAEEISVQNDHSNAKEDLPEPVTVFGDGSPTMNGNHDIAELNLKNKMNLLGTGESKECNDGDKTIGEGAKADLDQEVVADKLAELIPEVPVVPELNNTDTLSETATDIAVAH